MHTTAAPAPRRIRRLAGVAALTIAASGVLIGCGASSSDDGASQERTESSRRAERDGQSPVDTALGSAGANAASASTSTSAPAAGGQGNSSGQPPTGGGQQPSGGGQPSNGGQSSGGGQPSNGQPSGGQPAPTTVPTPPTTAPAANPAPVITSFVTPESIDCHNGNFQEFTASWTTQHATRVTISIDGPGVYNEYPANGETSLPFNCSSSHSFLLTAYNADGMTATRSITLDPRNVQTPGMPEDEEL